MRERGQMRGSIARLVWTAFVLAVWPVLAMSPRNQATSFRCPSL